MLRRPVISWTMVILAIVVSMAFVILGCEKSTGKIATVESMGAWNSIKYPYNSVLRVDLKPTSRAQANIDYIVELYEKNELRDETRMSWNQLELNVFETKPAEFPISQAEYETYLWKDVSHIFTVKVYEQSQATPDLGETTSEYFRDPRLETAVRDAIGESKGGYYFSGEITKLDLGALKELYADMRKITDLKGLELCTNLSFLSLGNNNITDITRLSKLTRITELYLNGNQISNISALEGLTNLNMLELSYNKISDISSLVRNKGLGEGDIVGLEENPLSRSSLNVYLPQLEQRGVQVDME